MTARIWDEAMSARPGWLEPARRWPTSSSGCSRTRRSPGPTCLYGSSLGGLISLSHTVRLPNAVAGLILDNALGPESAAGAIRQENLDLSAEAAQLLTTTLGDRPVVVLDSDATSDGAALARRSTNSILVNAPGTGHFIAGDAPQLVRRGHTTRGYVGADGREAAALRANTVAERRRKLRNRLEERPNRTTTPREVTLRCGAARLQPGCSGPL